MHQIFYITPTPGKALGIEALLPSFHILHSDNSQLSVPISNAGIDIKNFPLPNEKIHESKTFRLLQNDALQKYIKDHSHETPDILLSENDKQSEALVKKLGYNLLNPKFEITSSLSIAADLDKFIEEAQIFPKSKNAHKDCIVYTVTGCITRLGIILGSISEQIRGIDLLSSSKTITLGNDFSQRHLNDYLRADLVSKTTELGNLLMKLGHSGLFSIDVEYCTEDNVFYLININLQQDSSVNFASFLQINNKQTPLMLWHALELLNHNYYEKFDSVDDVAEEWINQEIDKFRLSNDKLNYNLESIQPINASQIIFRNTKDHEVKILDQFPSGIFRIRGRLPEEAALMEDEEKYPAVYRMREDGWSTLCLIRRGYNILEAIGENGFLIDCAPENSIISVDGEIGRIEVMESAFSSKDTRDLNGWITDTINTIYENIRLIKA